MRILITGHTGFKGSWLSILLKELGHDLYGYALPPKNESIFWQANLTRLYVSEVYSDIRNYYELNSYLEANSPDLVIHLAAQPLVRYSYANPDETFTVNVNGTFNVLTAFENSQTASRLLVITTDKVYRNNDSITAFKESDSLGSSDPYSTSKAMADLLTQSWITSISEKQIAIARAGNVLGGGDFSTDRLIPDLFRSIQSRTAPTLRNPNSVRPWQHVLDCLNGYVHLITNASVSNFSTPWNFGPDNHEYRTVREVTREFVSYFSLNAWEESTEGTINEKDFLTLDSSKAKSELGWRNKLNFEQTIQWTADWYESFINGQNTLRAIKF
jgi:CDP-glucose 4,6-dehydratase